MQTILLPLDGSATAEQILPYVRLLAQLLKAGVHLIRVVPNDEVDRTSGDLPVLREPGALQALGWDRRQLVETMLREHAERYLDHAAGPLRAAGLVVTSEVRVGSPADHILDALPEQEGVLVAMTTHGYSGLRRWTTGSVTSKVVHATHRPTLILRCVTPTLARGQGLSLSRLLVPLDGSRAAEQALPLVAELAASAQAEVILLRAIGHGDDSEPIPAQRDEAEQELEALAGTLVAQQLMVTPVVEAGYAAEVIVDEAEHRAADMIVMTSHGRSGLRRWMLGGVATKVLHATTKPLLIVPLR